MVLRVRVNGGSVTPLVQSMRSANFLLLKLMVGVFLFLTQLLPIWVLSSPGPLRLQILLTANLLSCSSSLQSIVCKIASGWAYQAPLFTVSLTMSVTFFFWLLSSSSWYNICLGPSTQECFTLMLNQLGMYTPMINSIISLNFSTFFLDKPRFEIQSLHSLQAVVNQREWLTGPISNCASVFEMFPVLMAHTVQVSRIYCFLTQSLFHVVFSVRNQQYLLFSLLLFLLRNVFSVTILGSFSENSTNLLTSMFTWELLNSPWEIDRFCIISYFCIDLSFS